jgi:hypothetical protein
MPLNGKKQSGKKRPDKKQAMALLSSASAPAARCRCATPLNSNRYGRV